MTPGPLRGTSGTTPLLCPAGWVCRPPAPWQKLPRPTDAIEPADAVPNVDRMMLPWQADSHGPRLGRFHSCAEDKSSGCRVHPLEFGSAFRLRLISGLAKVT